MSAFSARWSSFSNRSRCVIYEVIMDDNPMTSHLLQTPKPDTLILSNLTIIHAIRTVWFYLTLKNVIYFCNELYFGNVFFEIVFIANLFWKHFYY